MITINQTLIAKNEIKDNLGNTYAAGSKASVIAIEDYSGKEGTLPDGRRVKIKEGTFRYTVQFAGHVDKLVLSKQHIEALFNMVLD